MQIENNTVIESNMEGQQPTERIIKLNTSTKVLYSLFNFFTPISVAYGALWAFQIFNFTGTLIAFLSIGVGLFCLLYNLRKYNRFLWIKENVLYVCRGKIAAPEIVERIQVEGNDVSWSGSLSLDYNGKKVTLLDAYPSWIGIICVFGKFVWIPVVLGYMMKLYFVSELYQGFPQLFSREPKKVTRSTVAVFAVLMWLFTVIISVVGLYGVLVAPFYAFIEVGA